MADLILAQKGIADTRHEHHRDEEGNERLGRHLVRRVCIAGGGRGCSTTGVGNWGKLGRLGLDNGASPERGCWRG